MMEEKQLDLLVEKVLIDRCESNTGLLQFLGFRSPLSISAVITKNLPQSADWVFFMP